MELSFSVIKTYTFCPWKYKLVYEDKWYLGPTPASSLGHSIHGALDDYHRRQGKSFDELMDSYSTAWVNEGFNSALQAQEYFEKGEKILNVYWQESLICDSEIVCTEKEFAIDTGKNIIRGTVDRIDKHRDGSYELIEYKTHANLWTQEGVDKDLQLSLYAYACSKCFNIDIKVLSYYFLAHNKKIFTTRSLQQMDDAIGLAEDVSQQVEKKMFEPKTESCKYCNLKERCSKSIYKSEK